MSNADNGFRFGSKKDMWPAGGEWVHVEGKHPKYEIARKDQHKLDTWDNTLLASEEKLQKVIDLVRFQRALLLGGHVRRDKLAVVQERANELDDPEQLIAQLRDMIKSMGLSSPA